MEKVTYSLKEGIAHITMDDGKANSMNWIFFEEMGKYMDQAENEGGKSTCDYGPSRFFFRWP